MTVIFLIIVFLSVFFIIGNILRNIKFKKITIKYLNSSYGKKPSNSSKTNFDFLGKYYKERINYNKLETEKIENLISIFEKNCNLRNTIGLNLMKISKFNNKSITSSYIFIIFPVLFITKFSLKISFIFSIAFSPVQCETAIEFIFNFLKSLIVLSIVISSASIM